MADEPEVGRIIVEALRREGGEATADGPIYAYIKIRERFRNSRELIEFVKESLADEVEVIEEILYPYRDDVERAIFLRLKGMGKARLVRIRRRLGGLSGSLWRAVRASGRIRAIMARGIGYGSARRRINQGGGGPCWRLG